MKQITSLLPWVGPYAGSAPSNVQVQQLKMGARQFCQDTEIWRETIGPFTVAEDAETVQLAAPNEFVSIIRVLSLAHDGKDVCHISYEIDNDDLVTFVRPLKAGDIEAVVALIPKVTISEIPDWLYDRWGTAFVHYALGTLKAMDGQPWYEPQMAGVHMSEYAYQVGQAKGAIAHSRKSGLQIKVPKFI